MPSLAEHVDMLEDRVRCRAYAIAIRKAVRPGAVVLDLGCGTGILGLLALKAGAKSVRLHDRRPI